MSSTLIIVQLVVWLFYSYCLYVIASKLKEEYTWMAFVPLLSLYLQLRMAKLSLWWLLGLFVPLWNIYVIIKIIHNAISVRTGHGGWWTAGLICFWWIMFPVTAFGYTPTAPSNDGRLTQD